MKKLLSLTTAAVLCMGAVSCGKRSSENTAEKSASHDISGDTSGNSYPDIRITNKTADRIVTSDPVCLLLFF